MDIYIDGFIGQGDFFTEGYSLKKLRDEINTLPKDTKEINIHINSGGGDVTEGFAIYDYLNTLGYTVNTFAEGMVGSIATVIFQAGRKGKRVMNANSDFFIHNPYWTPQGPEPMEASDAQRLAEMLKKTEEKILNFYVQHTSGKSKEEIQDKMKAQTSFTAQEAVEWGFADEINDSPIKNKARYRVMAYINTNQKQNNMANEFEGAFAKFEASITNTLKNLFGKQIKNELHKTSEGVEIYFDGGLEVGKAIFTDEAMTVAAPDGVHTIDGKKVIITDGKVSEIEEASVDANTELKAEIEALKATIAEKETALKNSITEKESLTAQVAEAKSAVEDLQTQFLNFKNEVVTGKQEPKQDGQNFKGSEPAKSIAQQVLEMRANKK